MAEHAPADTVPWCYNYRFYKLLFAWRTKCEDLRLFVIDGGRKNPE